VLARYFGGGQIKDDEVGETCYSCAFDYMLVINKTPNKYQPVERSV
jgi:hypothetical protein